MSKPFDIMSMPDDLPDFVTSDCGDYPVEPPRTPLVLPQPWIVAIQSEGWIYRGAGPEICFFDRPGIWLCVHQHPHHPERFSASVMPAYCQPGKERLDYAPEQLSPDFTGRGAIARAKAYADGLIDENQAWLADLGIELRQVAARLWTGWGSGGRVTNRTYDVEHRCFL